MTKILTVLFIIILSIGAYNWATSTGTQHKVQDIGQRIVLDGRVYEITEGVHFNVNQGDSGDEGTMLCLTPVTEVK